MSSSDSGDNIVVETTTKIFQDLGDPQTLNNAPDDGWRAPLWNALQESGLTLAWVPDDLGGAGAEIGDGFDVLRVAGRFAAPVPLAETLLAGWLLSRARLVSPAGAMSVAPVRTGDEIGVAPDGTLSGRARAVPFADEVDHLAVLAEGAEGFSVGLVASSDCALTDCTGRGADPRADVRLDGVTPEAMAGAPAGLDANGLAAMGASVRSMQMRGALEAVLEMATAYAGERVAFGRPIGKFQAVQHNLAVLAGEVAAAIAAAGSAADAIGASGGIDDGVFLEVASAKIRVGEAVTEGAAIAHQVHGAIGFTAEHILQRYTRRMWAWRDEFGNESQWAVRLGEHVAARGADELWPMLAER